MQERILIYDFGSQYTQLIARRVREQNVFCEILPYHQFKLADVEAEGVKGVILSGSPHSVRDANAPLLEKAELEKVKVPLLGVCYGAQMLIHLWGGVVAPSTTREYGRANLAYIQTEHPLFKGFYADSQVWMSHADTVLKLPDVVEKIASTKSVDLAAFQFTDLPFCGIQFHPEVYHSTQGKQLIENFLIDLCGCQADWTAENFIDESIKAIQDKVGNEGKVVMGLSGGVDSSVAATLIDRAIGDRLFCIFVDNGLLRKNEYEEVLEAYKELGLNVKGVNAANLFLNELEGVSDPEQKRKIIGRNFIEVFDQEAGKLDNVQWLGQGTIYPDVIESVSVNGPSATIKSHHNVGGLPETMKLKVLEPMNLLFKDEVRNIGTALGLPKAIIGRHPFPGPGLAIRIPGEITKDKVKLLQLADAIYVDELKQSGWYDKVWQAGAILLPVDSVGVMGDERTYEKVVALRAVTSTDGMTADWVHLPYELLANISNRIINEVKGINRVVYDISSKPPATIEWE